ncbi:hypothetical protein [Dactylosporangium fulvum]|uniref:Integral membrane protein n=1 Tax=Dactylosporangium fulvum TaxID=53359 RepID=A0ABY5W914_9ACTN|nr:hypothetical protein [Dactylosporangium fulvum]UWP85865.1 hypothetical protein Dfulv_17100 [Dactylosporangium fulvum]
MAVQPPVQWRRAAGYYAWRSLTAALIVLVVGWDAVSLTFFPDVGFRSNAYTLLRNVSPWGMEGYGPPLMALFLLSVYAYGRHRGGTGHSYVLLRLTLSAVAVWYTGWTAGIIGSWLLVGEISSLGIGKLLFIAVTCIILARLTPTSLPPRKG